MPNNAQNIRPQRGHSRIDQSYQAQRRRPGRQERRPKRQVSVGSILESIRNFYMSHKKLCISVAIVLLLVLSIFKPLRDYYISVRTHEILAQNYEELSQTNATLKQDVERLQTEEGIQDEARKRGYVGQGETAVTVEGQSDSDDDQSQDDPSKKEEYVDRRDMKTRILDTLFAFDPRSVAR